MIELSAENLQLPLICHCCVADNAPAIFTAAPLPRHLNPRKGLVYQDRPIWDRPLVTATLSHLTI